MWVGLIQSVEGLNRTKNTNTFLSGREFFPDLLKLGHQLFPAFGLKLKHQLFLGLETSAF